MSGILALAGFAGLLAVMVCLPVLGALVLDVLARRRHFGGGRGL